MSPACPPDLAPRPRRPYETSSAVFAFPRVLTFWAFFFVEPVRASFAFFAAGFFFRAEAFPIFDFSDFLFLADMFLNRLLSESITPHSRGASATITGNFDCRHYNALKEVGSIKPPGISTGWAPGSASAMNKEDLRKRVEEVGLVPSIRTSSAEDARFAVEEVAHGGIPIIEVTMTVPGALDVIREIVRNVPEVILGAGTVLDVPTARQCIAAGAQFISSPALDVPTIQLVAENPSVLMIAGALTPTEILAAWKAGSDFIKVFPVSLVGADNYIRALRRPFPDVPLIAGGGITQQNAAQYLLAGAAALSVGKELIPRESMLLHKPDRIRELTRRFAGIVKNTRIRMAEAHAQVATFH